MADLTPTLRERLAAIAQGSKEFNLRRSYDRQALNDYKSLRRMGYCSEHETGAGGSVLIYRITDNGKQALDESA